MSFSQEMKDFLIAMQAGSRIVSAWDDRKYKQLRMKLLEQQIRDYPTDHAFKRMLMQQQLEDWKENREYRRQRLRQIDEQHKSNDEYRRERLKQIDRGLDMRGNKNGQPTTPSADDILGPQSDASYSIDGDDNDLDDTDVSQAIPTGDSYRGSTDMSARSKGGGLTYDKWASIQRVANNLGVDPNNLKAVIGYESEGTFSPDIYGGKGGKYLGLIQFGPEEQRTYGARPGQSFDQQMDAVERYFKDRGLKPGMDLAHMYSIVNAGSLDANGQPRWNANDGNGTVRQHVARIKSDFLDLQPSGISSPSRSRDSYDVASNSSAIPTPSTDQPLAYNSRTGTPGGDPGYDPSEKAIPDPDDYGWGNGDTYGNAAGDMDASTGGDMYAGYSGGEDLDLGGIDQAPEVTGTAFDTMSPAGIDFGIFAARGGLVKRYADGGVVSDDDDTDDQPTQAINPYYDGPGSLNYGTDGPSGSEGVTSKGNEVANEGSKDQPYSPIMLRDALATGYSAMKKMLAGGDQAQGDVPLPTARPPVPGDQADVPLPSSRPTQAIPVGEAPETDLPGDTEGEKTASAGYVGDVGDGASEGAIPDSTEMSALAAKQPKPFDPTAQTRAPRSRSASQQTGAGGAMPTPQEFIRLKDMVAQRWLKDHPDQPLSEAEKTAQAYAAVQNFYIQRGEPEKAKQVLGSMLLYNRMMSQKWAAIAAVAGQHGDMDGATKALEMYAANIPGHLVNIDKLGDGSLAVSFDRGDGTQQTMRVDSPDQIAKAAMQWGGPGTFDELVQHAIQGNPPPIQPQPAKQSDRIASEKFVSEGEVPASVPQEAQSAVREMAASIYTANGTGGGITRGRAIAVGAALLNPDDRSIKVAAQPNQDGSRTAQLSDGTQIVIPHNVWLQVQAQRGAVLQQRARAAQSAKEEADKRSALEKQQAEHEQKNAEQMKHSITKFATPMRPTGTLPRPIGGYSWEQQ